MNKLPTYLRVVILSEDTSILAAGSVFDIVKDDSKPDRYLIGVVYEGVEVYYRLNMKSVDMNCLIWDIENGRSVDKVYVHPTLGKRYFHFYRHMVV